MPQDDLWKAAFDILEGAQDLPLADRQEFIESQTSDPRLREMVAGLLLEQEEEAEPENVPKTAERVGQYEIVSKLGAGGSGMVFRARDIELDRPVALKFLSNAQLVEGKKATDLLIREAKAASALNHPNIITIHGVVRDEAGVCTAIAMELVEGDSLRTFCIPGSPQPMERVLRWGRQIASALAAAHAESIVHRDIKPENLIVRRADDNIKVLDFGLARRSRVGQESTVSQLGAGTIDYFSPEQAASKKPTSASDVFSLGMVLYELSAGRHPFDGETPLDRLYAICNKEPESAAAADPRVPKDVSALLGRMLAKDPAKRPPAAEVERALAEAHDRLSRPAQPATSRRWPWLAAAAVVTGVVLGGLAYRGLEQRNRAIDAIAVLPFRFTDTSLEYLSGGLRHEIALGLAMTPGLRVVTNAGADEERARRELGVAAVLSGRLSRSGKSIALEAELIDARTGGQLWSGQFTQPAGEIASFPRDVSGMIGSRLGARVAARPRASSQNPEAYEAYLRARYHYIRRTRADMELASRSCEEALAIDPKFGAAWALLAASQGFTPGMYNSLPPAELYAKMHNAIARAIEIDPDLPEVHLTLGGVKLFQERDWAGAESELRRAIALNPSESQAYLFLAILMRALGRGSEERQFVRKARELDPLSALVANHVAWTEYFRGDDAAALDELGKAMKLDPTYSSHQTLLGYLELRAGRFPQAIAAFQKATETAGGLASRGDLGYAYAASGDRASAMRVLRELEAGTGGYTPAGAIAWVHMGLGDRDHAFQWFDKAVTENYQWLNYVRIWRVFDPLRQDPRIQQLERKLRLDGAR